MSTLQQITFRTTASTGTAVKKDFGGKLADLIISVSSAATTAKKTMDSFEEFKYKKEARERAVSDRNDNIEISKITKKLYDELESQGVYSMTEPIEREEKIAEIIEKYSSDGSIANIKSESKKNNFLTALNKINISEDLKIGAEKIKQNMIEQNRIVQKKKIEDMLETAEILEGEQ
jgi:predicted RND superfamily exporter protein